MCDDNTDIFTVFGYIGGFMLALGPAYQTYKMYKKKRTKDVSMKWSINYVIGMTFTNTFTIKRMILPILIGGLIELTNMLIMIGYKIYTEKKFLRFRFAKKDIKIINMKDTSYKEVYSTDKVTISIRHDDLDDITDMSNNDDDLFIQTFTLAKLEQMLSMIKNTNQTIDHTLIHQELHYGNIV